MRVLAVVHGELVGPARFAEVIDQRGHELEIWSSALAAAPARPLGEYGAILVFGGVMHADEEELHPWLRTENDVLQELLDVEAPVLGICLGAHLLAKAGQAAVKPAREPEIGWCETELTHEALDDPLFTRLPRRFFAFEWHHYTYRTPDGGVELARSRHCPQAFRLGRCAWGVQFHPEITEQQILNWLSQFATPAASERIATETRQRIEAWNSLGRSLCERFLEIAEAGAAGRRDS